MSFPKYPRYKDSGIEWLGEVPEHWDIWKVAHAFSHIGSGTTPPSEESEWYGGDICWVTTGELRETRIYETAKKVTREAVRKFGALKLHPPESVLIALYGATIGRLGILGIEATANQACCALAKSQVLSEKFTFYWLLAFRNEIISLSSGGGQPNISQEKIASLKIPAPEHSEQDGIVTFLDRETAKIDTLIAKQERLIELLQEKRQALISHAVTKGLNPNAPMKDSSLEWLGEVPKHWEPIRIGFLFKQRKRQGFDNEPVLSVYRDFGVIYKNSRDDNINKTPEDLSLYQLVEEGDLVINKMKAWQGSLGVSNLRGITSPDYIVYTPKHNESPEFLHFLFRSKALSRVYLSISNGIRPDQWRLEPDKFESLRVFLPPTEEQSVISQYLIRELQKFDELETESSRAIELLKEHRTALISAAVTGKIDVRETANRAEAAALP